MRRNSRFCYCCLGRLIEGREALERFIEPFFKEVIESN